MSNRYFDNWERLVTATLRREELRELARAHSRDPSLASVSSDFSFTSPLPYLLQDPEASSSSSIPLPTPRPEERILQLHYPMPISFNELKYATGNFRPSNILGYEECGPVFEGWINTRTLSAAKPGSGMAVAIKKCNGIPGFNEWSKEVNFQFQLLHPNLIKLLAYCDDGDNLFLVYEFMMNGSLFNYLFRGGRQPLSWDMRIKVAIGAAKGLSFLHDFGKKAISKNFRSSNILLDKDFNAKLSDFGYAKEVGIPYETPMGASYGLYEYIGYASPEYTASGYLSEECDVYTFGVVLLELLCRRQAFDITGTLVAWAKPYLSNKKRVHEVMDPQLEVKYPHKGVLVFATLALRCVSEDPLTRPHLAEVLAVLERIKGLS